MNILCRRWTPKKFFLCNLICYAYPLSYYDNKYLKTHFWVEQIVHRANIQAFQESRAWFLSNLFLKNGTIFWVNLNFSLFYQNVNGKGRFHGSTPAAMPTVMLDDPGSNPGVNHGCMYLSRRTNVFCLVLSKSCSVSSVGQKTILFSISKSTKNYLFHLWDRIVSSDVIGPESLSTTPHPDSEVFGLDLNSPTLRSVQQNISEILNRGQRENIIWTFFFLTPQKIRVVWPVGPLTAI
jgi:hypothetical protein